VKTLIVNDYRWSAYIATLTAGTCIICRRPIDQGAVGVLWEFNATSATSTAHLRCVNTNYQCWPAILELAKTEPLVRQAFILET